MHDAPYDDDDMDISTDGRDLSDALHLPTENRVFYHGTSKRNARRILREGLRDWSWTESTPNFKYKAGEGVTRWLHDGMYGRGTYVSCNWRVALYFGPVMFRVELQPGTRLLRLDVPPKRKTLDTLQAMITTMHRTTNPGAANTRRWFAEANQAFRATEAG